MCVDILQQAVIRYVHLTSLWFVDGNNQLLSVCKLEQFQSHLDGGSVEDKYISVEDKYNNNIIYQSEHEHAHWESIVTDLWITCMLDSEKHKRIISMKLLFQR